MDIELLKEKVAAIIQRGIADPEVAHADEDALLYELLGLYLPQEHMVEIERLADADFQRWYA